MKNSGNTTVLKSEDMEIEKQSTGAHRRKRIWQIHSGYHCSIIGTCLSPHDLKQIVREKVFSLDSGTDVFSIHRALTIIAQEKLPETRALNKLLDQKFRGSIKRYARLSGDEEIEDVWRTDLNVEGVVPGAFWAIMSHPCCGKDVLDRVYGDCHMLGCDLFALRSNNARKIEKLKRQIGTVQSSLEKTKATYEMDRERIRWEFYELQKGKAEFLRQRLVNGHLVKQNTELKEKLQKRESGEEQTILRNELASLRKDNEKLRREIKHNSEGLLNTTQQQKAAEAKIDFLKIERGKVKVLNVELKEEIASLEAMFQLSIVSKTECDICEKKLFDDCEGIGLLGKAVLYVGGRRDMIAHYRKMVEANGGVFLHHDGGKGNSRTLLPELLSGVDAVLCPVDCVSQDACTCVKKICKRNRTPFVMMRSAGLSSLAKGLETITQ